MTLLNDLAEILKKRIGADAIAHAIVDVLIVAAHESEPVPVIPPRPLREAQVKRQKKPVVDLCDTPEALAKVRAVGSVWDDLYPGCNMDAVRGAYQQGVKASEDVVLDDDEKDPGEEFGDNPYPAGGALHEAWGRGRAGLLMGPIE